MGICRCVLLHVLAVGLSFINTVPQGVSICHGHTYIVGFQQEVVACWRLYTLRGARQAFQEEAVCSMSCMLFSLL